MWIVFRAVVDWNPNAEAQELRLLTVSWQRQYPSLCLLQAELAVDAIRRRRKIYLSLYCSTPLKKNFPVDRHVVLLPNLVGTLV
jgi:hypothetical protein